MTFVFPCSLSPGGFKLIYNQRSAIFKLVLRGVSVGVREISYKCGETLGFYQISVLGNRHHV